MKRLMVGRSIFKKEADELEKICNHYLEKRTDIIKNTQFKIEDVFSHIVG